MKKYCNNRTYETPRHVLNPSNHIPFLAMFLNRCLAVLNATDVGDLPGIVLYNGLSAKFSDAQDSRLQMEILSI